MTERTGSESPLHVVRNRAAGTRRLATVLRFPAMARITINGKSCEFSGSPSILEVALANGLEIPHYCWHEGLSVVASCRICLAEVWAPNPRSGELEPIPRLLPTCQTPCGDGQIVRTDSPKAVANQKAVMEYLLINHPLDCPICDQAGECYLQDYSYEYGRGESRFEEEKIKQPKKDVGPHIYLYSDRCIMCSRCVRFTREVTGTAELCVVGRGSGEQIDLFPGEALDNELSGNVADICPVGALLDKDFLFSQRVWLLTKTPSIDGLTASGDNISIEHNQGRIYRVKPRRNLAVNKWWISDEVRYGWKFIHSDERLAEPRRLQYGEQVGTSFSAAYDEIDERLAAARSAGSKVAALVSPMLSCEEAYLMGRWVRAASGEGTKVILGVGPVPVSGEDKTFPPGACPTDRNAFTIRAEKAPNARGVRRVLSAIGGVGAFEGDPAAGTQRLAAGTSRRASEPLLEFAQWLAAIKDAEIVILTGNYPSEWVTKDLTKALSRKFIVLIDTLPNELTGKANVLLPGATWAEKSGTFENHLGLLQTFEQAVAPVEGSRSEGQIFTDLLARRTASGNGHGSPRFDAAAVRRGMAESLGLMEFVREVQSPAAGSFIESDMELVEL